MKINLKTSAFILLCSVSLTGCEPQSKKEKAPARTAIAGSVIHISSEQEFNATISQGNVLVDFYASWCGPCQRMSPIIDELAKEMTDVTFVKVDTDKFDALCKNYAIRSLPTLAFFKNGNKVHTITGARSKVELRNEIKKTF